jgi:hypothetical protein
MKYYRKNIYFYPYRININFTVNYTQRLSVFPKWYVAQKAVRTAQKIK